ncbi:rfc3 (nucleomorph) [Hemiselmis andersenii]|uniref:Rfc3 n=1 Tax=Hemiselmis andersenii TaxID=464988 RepID=A9BL45_HEMAN|nr:rfc3 [Hemiselmis andersenii]ABW98228.1 rfc3 [Hemiselmis andersenii]|mmetsp:Transcript_33858/g.82521  ORF Transcript_33858/g.82521 Transcript_33858/m.82521 type:complete len:305 (-) Transcript_33858:2228-3142(-)
MWLGKYSARSIVDLISNETQINNFIKNFQNSNFLIQGTNGIGKSSFSLISSREIFNNISKINILNIDGLEETKIGIVKNRIKHFLDSGFSQIESKKLVIIDNSDHLSFSSQLNLREKMERIEKGLNFWFICKSLNKINPTIISRCLVLNFKPSSPFSLCIRLHEIAEKEKLDLCFETIFDSIFSGNGDIRYSINSLFQKNLFLSKNFFPTILRKNFSSKSLILKLKESLQKDFRIVFFRKIVLIAKILNISIAQIKKDLNTSLVNTALFFSKKKILKEYEKSKSGSSFYFFRTFFNNLIKEQSF